MRYLLASLVLFSYLTYSFANAKSWMFVPSGSAFTPNSVASCSSGFWLDGTDPAGTGTPPANSSAVGTWVDKSTSGGHNWTQATAGNKPTFQTSVVNSAASLLFTHASNQYVQSSTAFMVAGTAFDYFFVITPTSVPAASFFYNDGQTNAPVFGFSSTLFTVIAGAANWANGTFTQTFTTNQTYLIEYQYNGTGATTNGNFIASAQNSVLTRTGNDSGHGSTSLSAIGSDIVDPVDAFGGYISEVVYCTAQLGSTDRTSMQNYLFARWNY